MFVVARKKHAIACFFLNEVAPVGLTKQNEDAARMKELEREERERGRLRFIPSFL